MAQTLPDRPNHPEKVAIRLERPLAQMTPEAPVVPANAMLDSEGRIVPMRPATIGGDDNGEACSGSRKLRPAEIRAIATREAEAIKFPLETLNAVLRAESQLGAQTTQAGGPTIPPRITPTLDLPARSCAEMTASIQRGVAQLYALRHRYPNPLHHFAAYRDGEEAFIASGGVPRSEETLRFVVIALHELAGPIGELPMLTQTAPPLSAQAGAHESASPRSKERQSASPDPRWASGFVFNLE